MAVLNWRFEVSNVSTDGGSDPASDSGGEQQTQNAESPVQITSTAKLTTIIIATTTDQTTTDGNVSTSSTNAMDVLTTSVNSDSAAIPSVAPGTPAFQTTSKVQTSTTRSHGPIGFDGPHATTVKPSSNQTVSQANTFTLQTFATASGTATPATINDQHNSAQSNLVPVIAGVIPSIVILSVAFFCFWRRHRRKTRCQQSKSLGQNHSAHTPALSTNEKIENHHDLGAGINPSPENSTVTLHIQKKQRPSMIQIPPRRNNRRPNLQTPDLEDPFLTPTNQTTFADIHDDSSELRTSQIGLAVTTPPSVIHDHTQNNSTTSLQSSILTVIHNATQRLSNPFRDPIDPKLATAGGGGGSSSSNDSVDSVIEKGQHDHYIKPDTDRQAPQTESSNATNSAGIPKSDTPPEELARRWIEVLKLEAAQAQVAAEEAAKVARELKLKHQSKDIKH